MIKIPGLFISKVFALLLTFLLLFPAAWGNDTKNLYDSALKEYEAGLFREAASRLESLLEIQEQDRESRAKALLLLGACYDKLAEKDKSAASFLELKEMIDNKLIDKVPEIEGIDPASFPAYREIFQGTSFFPYKEPVPVSEMMKKNVVQAPRKSLEKREREKRKKKFPWLIAVGAAVIIGTVTVLLLSKKSGEEQLTFNEIEWVRIPAGEFLMGDNFNEGDADELPVHKVYLDEYYISKYEITCEQYKYFCDDTGRVYTDPNFAQKYFLRSKIPARRIPYHDAQAFCDWLSLRTGEKVRLPTEAQWEKAARGTQQSRYPWGNTPPDCNLANYQGCPGAIDFTFAGFFPVDFLGEGKSPYGVYNMAGNVREWCSDWYSSSYYSISPAKNPPGPGNGTMRVVRGGSRHTGLHSLRSAKRDHKEPGSYLPDLGFRVVKEK